LREAPWLSLLFGCGYCPRQVTWPLWKQWRCWKGRNLICVCPSVWMLKAARVAFPKESGSLGVECLVQGDNRGFDVLSSRNHHLLCACYWVRLCFGLSTDCVWIMLIRVNGCKGVLERETAQQEEGRWEYTGARFRCCSSCMELGWLNATPPFSAPPALV
jgi:hypothetical protein